ncbi:MAG TPA: ABC transporter permease [Candidatus Baltobacteraceae bacterium]|nr:ABC transporter permease [Candidatus Baltobacteraceae bacterium]
MSVLGVIFGAEFVRRLTSRPFIFATLIGALGIVLIAVLPRVLGGFGADSGRVVLAGERTLTTTARSLLAPDFSVTAVVPDLPAKPTLAFLDAHGKASSAALLTRDARGIRVTVYARDPSQFRSAFARDLAPLQVALATGVPVAAVRSHLSVPVDVRGVGGPFADESAAVAAKGIAYLFVFLIYLAILLNAQSIMAAVAEEKTSRIAELLVATVDPTVLLTGKILASAATGFIQLGVWIVVGVLSGNAVTTMFANGSHGSGAAQAAGAMGPLAVSPGVILGFIAFFLIGFVQYSVLYAAAASLINRTEDLGSVAMPLVFPVIVGFILAQLAIENPNAGNVVAFSQIPLLAPFVMFTRIAVGAVPAWQVVVAIVINVAAAALFAWLAGRVYRVGLLLYGRPPSLRQIVATLRA